MALAYCTCNKEANMDIQEMMDKLNSLTNKYDVAYDVNGDGKMETVVFDNSAAGKSYEDCFVKDSETPECTNWIFKQAKKTTFHTSAVTILWEDGRLNLPSRTSDSVDNQAYSFVESVEWTPGGQGAYTAIERLWTNTKELFKKEPREFTTALLNYASGRFSTSEQKFWIDTILKKANEHTEKDRLTDKQLAVLSTIMWKFKNTIFEDVERKVNPMNTYEKIMEVFTHFEEKYFDADCSMPFSYEYNLPDILLTDDELIALHRLFGKFKLSFAEGTFK
jgi:hypothetical protein